MTELIIAGEAFNVLVEGEESAPVLMLSNSLGTNLHMWDKQIPAFAEHFRVVRYDSRGHGGSRVTEGPYSIAQLGRDAVAIMDALGLEKVHWLGLSMGGMVGQWLLTHVPERIGRAVLANTAAQMGSPDFWNERIRAALDDGMPALAPQVVERWFTRSFRETHREDVARVLAVLEATSPVGYAACCAAIRDMDQRAELGSVTRPVLVIAGRHDPATPPGMGALIASAIPGAKLVTLDTAHLSNIEDPATFNRTVLDFLTAEEADLRFAVPLAAEPKLAEPAAETPKKPHHKPAPRKPSAPAAPVTAQMPEVPPTAQAEALPEALAHEPKPKPTKKPARRRAPAAAPAPAPAVARPAPRRRPVKKAAAKRSATRKPAARGGVAKKAPVKKVTVKKATTRRAAAKKRTARPAVRKTATKATAAKKLPARKVATRKSAVRKAVTKKTVARRAPAKKISVKKSAAKKAAIKRTTGKKIAIKKTVAKKLLRRPVASRRPAGKTAGRRGPGRKR
ncbi:MAG: 3-oxoadipate enol-lactonase [Beijerinckiaceae bacterium]